VDCVDVVVVEWEAELCLLGREGGKGRSERERGGKGREGKYRVQDVGEAEKSA
jgi:hypothetical protein